MTGDSNTRVPWREAKLSMDINQYRPITAQAHKQRLRRPNTYTGSVLTLHGTYKMDPGHSRTISALPHELKVVTGF